jgi:CDP-paratose synthetase
MIILLTGATGFLGSHLARSFVNDGHYVVAAVRDESETSKLLFTKNITLFNLSSRSIEEAFQVPTVPEVVVHTATCYGRDGEGSKEVFACNLELPMNLMEAGSVAGVHTFINADTFYPAVYSALPDYSLSKKQFLENGTQYSQEKALRFVNLRLEHVYGPGDARNKLIPSLIQKCLDHEPRIPLTRGTQKRDFIYVSDVVSAYSKVLARIDSMAPGFIEYGVGRGESISINEMALKIKKITNSRSELEFGALPDREDELMDSLADNSALKRQGWEPEVALEEGLTRTVVSLNPGERDI